MKGICGANCDGCELLKENKCKGCNSSKKCWVKSYIEIGGNDKFNEFKKQIIKEMNSLNIEGMPKVEELYQLHGSFVNLEYPLPSGKKVKLLKDNEIYLGNQLECIFDKNKCFGILANSGFLLVCEYKKNGINPEIIIYKRR